MGSHIGQSETRPTIFMMQSNLRFAAVVAIVAAGAGIAAMGKLERQIGFDSVREIWGDLVRDADQVTMKAAHVSTAEEVELGTKLSASMKGAWTEDQPLTEYVTGVAASQSLLVSNSGEQP